jgi:hypothetical protein
MTRIVVVLDNATIEADATQQVIDQVERTVANRTATASVHKMHPGHPSPALDAFWEVEVADEQVDEVIADLREISGVDGAYVKPRDEAP